MTSDHDEQYRFDLIFTTSWVDEHPDKVCHNSIDSFTKSADCEDKFGIYIQLKASDMRRRKSHKNCRVRLLHYIDLQTQSLHLTTSTISVYKKTGNPWALSVLSTQPSASSSFILSPLGHCPQPGRQQEVIKTSKTARLITCASSSYHLGNMMHSLSITQRRRPIPTEPKCLFALPSLVRVCPIC